MVAEMDVSCDNGSGPLHRDDDDAARIMYHGLTDSDDKASQSRNNRAGGGDQYEPATAFAAVF
jgi:hypothetical protein